jgi:hypothetical protein
VRKRAVQRFGGWFVLAAILLTAQPPSRLTSQVASNRATAYLHPTDVRDARAIWVNPAGLAIMREASVYAELAMSEPGARGRLRQINAGFNARGLSFAYQRDVFDAGARGHTYRLGIAGAAEGLAAGLAIAHYRGSGAQGTGWDIGATYDWLQGLTVGAVAANVGQPSIRGVPQRLTFVPGATWHPALARALGLSVHARVTTDSVAAYGFGVAWRSGPGTSRWPVEVIARLDTDGGLRRGAFALGLSMGGPDRLGVVASTPGDVSTVDAVSLYGLSTREPQRRR